MSWTIGPALLASTWSAVGASSLHDAVNEATADDADYAQSSDLSNGNIQSWLAPIVDRDTGAEQALPAGQHTIRLRASYINGSADIRVVGVRAFDDTSEDVGESVWYTLSDQFALVVASFETSASCNRLRLEVRKTPPDNSLPDGWIGLDGASIELDQAPLGLQE